MWISPFLDRRGGQVHSTRRFFRMIRHAYSSIGLIRNQDQEDTRHLPDWGWFPLGTKSASNWNEHCSCCYSRLVFTNLSATHTLIVWFKGPGGQNFTVLLPRYFDQENHRDVKVLFIIKHFHNSDHSWFAILKGGGFFDVRHHWSEVECLRRCGLRIGRSLYLPLRRMPQPFFIIFLLGLLAGFSAFNFFLHPFFPSLFPMVPLLSLWDGLCFHRWLSQVHQSVTKNIFCVQGQGIQLTMIET